MTEPGGTGRTSTISGVVEQSTATGVRIEGVWYSLPRDPETRPPDRGARVELRVTSRRFVTGLKILAPPPEPGEADRPVVRSSVLRSAARFAGTHAAPKRSTEALDLAASFETWVYRPMVSDEPDAEPADPHPPDRERRVRRESALASVVEFLANKPAAQPAHILVLAEAWERWLSRPAEDGPAF
jgi:hypothetical protein